MPDATLSSTNQTNHTKTAVRLVILLGIVSLFMVAPDRRGSAYGVFNTGYGLAWFAGSALMGLLYDIFLPALIAFFVIIQLAAVPVLYRLTKERVR